jgi:hypothetical protein
MKLFSAFFIFLSKKRNKWDIQNTSWWYGSSGSALA